MVHGTTNGVIPMFEDEYDDYESIPAQVKHLFKEDGGKWVLIQSGEMKTVEDVSRVQEGLRKEREDHKATKAKLNQFNGLDADEVHEKLDRIEELEAAAAGKIDENKINDMVEARLRAKTAPLERQINTLKGENSELQGDVESYKAREKRRTIHDHIRSAAATAKIRDTAMDDALLVGEHVFDVDESGNVVTKDNVGVTPGIEPSVWLTEVKKTRPHWWPESKGAGANGGDGGAGGINNPFSHEHWSMTEQGKLLREDRSKAEQLARAAGTTIGGPKPDK